MNANTYLRPLPEDVRGLLVDKFHEPNERLFELLGESFDWAKMIATVDRLSTDLRWVTELLFPAPEKAGRTDRVPSRGRRPSTPASLPEAAERRRRQPFDLAGWPVPAPG